MQQGAEIEHGAAHQQGPVAAGADFSDQAPRIGSEARGRIGLGRIDQIEQMVRHPRPRRNIRFCRAYIHASIDLGRIDADDLGPALQPLDQLQRQRRLAGRGRAGDGDERRRHECLIPKRH